MAFSRNSFGENAHFGVKMRKSIMCREKNLGGKALGNLEDRE